MTLIKFTGKPKTTRVGDSFLEPGDTISVPDGDVEIWTRGTFEILGPGNGYDDGEKTPEKPIPVPPPEDDEDDEQSAENGEEE